MKHFELEQFKSLQYEYVSAIPEDAVNDSEDDEDKANPDERLTQAALDKRIAPDNEYSDSEDEGEGGRRDQRCVISWLIWIVELSNTSCLVHSTHIGDLNI
jgi:hypothetical protein